MIHRRSAARARRRPAARRVAAAAVGTAAPLSIAVAMLLPFGGSIASADVPVDPTPTPTATPTATPTPTPTATPTPTPAAAPSLSGPATKASVNWAGTPSIVEEHSFSLTVAGTIDGQATAHIAILPSTTASCPASPLYPMQTATGVRVTVTANPAAAPSLAVAATTPGTTPATTPAATGGVLPGITSYTLTATPKDSGTYRLCGWLVATPASNEASTLSRFDQIIGVANQPATLNATIPDVARSADYFSVKVTGTTASTGRRVLLMGEPDHGQSCADMRKLAAGKRPLQSVVAVPSGNFSKTLRVRFASKSSGPELVCAQIVETNDRVPEATAQHTMVISEALKCVNTQTAISTTTSEIAVIRKRRDAALVRLNAAKKRLAPLRARVTKQRKISDNRIAAARKAVSRAKSAAARKKASRHLAAVRKTETQRIYNAGKGLRAANANIRSHQRTYNQYRTGANLLNATLTRTRKDLKKYCSPAGATTAAAVTASKPTGGV